MGDFTRVKSPMKIHGRFYLSKKTPDYKMTHQLFTLFWIISNILTFHFYTFSVIYTFYFYIAFEELTFYQKCSIKCVLYSLFYIYKPLDALVISTSINWDKMFGFWKYGNAMVYIIHDCPPPAGEALGKSVSTIGAHDVLVWLCDKSWRGCVLPWSPWHAPPGGCPLPTCPTERVS